MKNRKGFTMAELIGVVIILGVLALIAIPLMGNYIESSKIETAKRSAEGIVKSAQQYYADIVSAEGTFTYTKLDILENATMLKLTGELPDGGYLTIDEDSKVEVFLIKDKYCIIASSETSDTTSSTVLDDCIQS